jgi:hypothetical protein
MSYKDLDKARVAHVAKDKAAADKGKGKDGRKRKVAVQEAESNFEGYVEAQEAGSSVPLNDKKAERSSVQEPWPGRHPSR